MINNIRAIGLAAVLGSGVMLAHPATAHVSMLQNNEVMIEATDLGGGIYMLQGRGGNIGISVGDDGVFMIDDQYGAMAEKILAAISDITAQPVAYVLNTHWHSDHTGSNAAMTAAGAILLSHDNVRVRLKKGNQDWDVAPAADAALPTVTFSETTTFHWNGHEIHVFHFPNAHTDGDALVHFRDLNIIHTGDTLFSGWYPFIDLNSGGSVDGYIANLEALVAMTDNETKIIPGHGPLSGQAEILESIDMLKGAKAAVKALHDQGMNEDEIVAANPLAPWNEKFTWQFINGERMTRTIAKDLAQK